MTGDRCQACGQALSADEVAVTRKLISRGATSFLCIPCLAAHFEVRPEDIEERIRYFRETGCTLFS
ncbi:MAG: hypothetical protein IJ083_02215 [Clostridia bacterium]|nr:hypothetical protein [Clostridia bacterium]